MFDITFCSDVYLKVDLIDFSTLSIVRVLFYHVVTLFQVIRINFTSLYVLMIVFIDKFMRGFVDLFLMSKIYTHRCLDNCTSYRRMYTVLQQEVQVQ